MATSSRIGEWRRAARPLIWTAIADGVDLGLAGRALARYVEDRRPGEFAGRWPRRVWQDERRRAVGRLRRRREAAVEIAGWLAFQEGGPTCE